MKLPKLKSSLWGLSKGKFKVLAALVEKSLGVMALEQGFDTSRLHQEESRSISENVTWGQRKRFTDGKVSLPYGQFLGYEKGEDGLPKIVEKEALVVRLIYKLFL